MNSIEILKAAEAYSEQLQVRNALVVEANETERKYNKLAIELRKVNEQLRLLEKHLVSVSGGVE